MAEALNSVYKAGLIDRLEWSGLIEVMAQTSKWLAWYNQARLHSAIGYRPPIEVPSERTNPAATSGVATEEIKEKQPRQNPGLAIAMMAAAGAAISGGGSMACQKHQTGEVDWGRVGMDAAVGAIGGGTTGIAARGLSQGVRALAPTLTSSSTASTAPRTAATALRSSTTRAGLASGSGGAASNAAD